MNFSDRSKIRKYSLIIGVGLILIIAMAERYKKLTIDDLWAGIKSVPENANPKKHKITAISDLIFTEDGTVELGRMPTSTRVTGQALDAQRTSAYHNGYTYILSSDSSITYLKRASGTGSFSNRFTFGASDEAVYLCAFKNRLIAWWYKNSASALKLSFSIDEGATFTEVAWTFGYPMDHAIIGTTIYVLDQNNKIYSSTDGSTFALFADLTTTSNYARNIEVFDGMLYVAGEIKSAYSIAKNVFLGRFETATFKEIKKIAGAECSIGMSSDSSSLIMTIWDGSNTNRIYKIKVETVAALNRYDLTMEKIGQISGIGSNVIGADSRITYIGILLGTEEIIYEINENGGIYKNGTAYEYARGVLIASIAGKTVLMVSGQAAENYVDRYILSTTLKKDEGYMTIDLGDLDEHVPVAIRVLFEPGLKGTSTGNDAASPLLTINVDYDTQIAASHHEFNINKKNYERGLKLTGTDATAKLESNKYRSIVCKMEKTGTRLAVTGAKITMTLTTEATNTLTPKVKLLEYFYLPIGIENAK